MYELHQAGDSFVAAAGVTRCACASAHSGISQLLQACSTAGSTASSSTATHIARCRMPLASLVDAPMSILQSALDQHVCVPHVAAECRDRHWGMWGTWWLQSMF